MRAIIDTTSLVSFVRYYLPFDKEDKLKTLFKKKFHSGDLVVLDKVFDESKYVAKGIVVKELDFLSEKPRLIKTDLVLPDAKFFSILQNQLCYGAQKNKITPTEYDIEEKKFLDTADAKLVLFCDKNKGTLEVDKPVLITEETRTDNDSKLFKKLPEICSVLNIEHCTLPVLLKEHFNVRLSDYLQ